VVEKDKTAAAELAELIIDAKSSLG